MLCWPVVVGVSAVGLSLLAYFRFKHSGPKKHLSPFVGKTMLGKIAVITGASSGMGREVAYELAKRQMDVILACRDRVKAHKAVQFIEKRLIKESTPAQATNSDGGPFGKLHVMDLDLADLASIDSFAKDFRDRFGKLHLLINNAGLMGCPYSTSRGGLIEMHFAVNHLGHYHLTNLLLPVLKSSAPSRILTVASRYYRKLPQTGVSDFDESKLLDKVANGKPAVFDSLAAYAFSKLANCLHGVELARRLETDDVQVFVIRPGFVRGTELGRYYPILSTLASPFIWMVSQTMEKAAQTYLYCALTEKCPELKSGALYYDASQQPYLSNLVNEENASVMWRLSDRLVTMEKEAIERLSTKESNKQKDQIH